MDNLPIKGGVNLGAPKGWDPEAQGECLTISALPTMSPDGQGVTGWTTAWSLSAGELAAMLAHGTLFLHLPLSFFPPIQIWVQDGTELVGTLKSRAQADAARSRALRVIAKGLDARAPNSIGASRIEPMGEVELLEFIAAAVERLGWIADRAAPLWREIPIKTLDQLVAESLAKRDPAEDREDLVKRYMAAADTHLARVTRTHSISIGDARITMEDSAIMPELIAPEFGKSPVLMGLDLAKGEDMTATMAPPLKADFARVLPGGIMDDSLYEDVEVALDHAGAPSTRPEGEPCPEGKGRWYGVAERIAAYAGNVQALRSALADLGMTLDPDNAAQVAAWEKALKASTAVDPQA